MAARRTVKILAASAAVLASGAFAGTAIALASTNSGHPSRAHQDSGELQVKQILFGANLSHTFVPVNSSTPQTDPLKGPDDITVLGHHLFVGFQNGVGSQGEVSSDGNTFSTIVEFTGDGTVIAQWDIKGKCDGLGADPARDEVIATVNEDYNSSIYTIKPSAPSADQVAHYSYTSNPLAHNGGTDGVTTYRGKVLVSASAPGTSGAAAPQPTYPAVYVAHFHHSTLTTDLTPLFYDEDTARVANVGSAEGSTVTLGLTDPDSSAVVPPYASRFHGSFELDSQGDLEQIFVTSHGRHGQQLSVLTLSQSIDDSAWVRNGGRVYSTDASADTVDLITGHFPRGAELVAVTPCNANSAPATCPAPGFPAPYLGWLDQWTGNITPAVTTGAAIQPKGMVFVSGKAKGRV